jgi:CheY-like chemotaxis protein/HPt (histidine-containing phosphotransfer) domain-containing protein
MLKLDFSKFGHVKLLVAEDNEISQKMFGKIFEINNIQYKIVSNGLEVIESLKKEEFSLVLMDMQMPYLNGFETTKKIRESSNSYKDIPIIALTAKGWGDEQKEAYSAGVDDFIYKPFRIEVIMSVIFKTLERKIDSIADNKSVADGYNPEFIDEYFGDDETFKKEIVSEFLKKIPESLNEILNYLNSGDFVSAKKAAHKCKSSVSVFGITKAFEYLNQIESAVEIDSAKNIYSKLYAYMDTIYSILNNYIS